MMRLIFSPSSAFLFISLIILFYSPAYANECEPTAYVVSGSMEGNGRGARTWDLVRLKRESSGVQASSCVKQVYARALSESKDYWNYIAEKYQCGDSPSDNCPPARWQNVNQNRAYIASMSSERILASLEEECETPGPESIGHTTIENLRDLEDAISTAVATPESGALSQCDDVDPSRRANADGTDLGEAVGACVVGALKGFFKDGVWNFVTEIWDFLSNPVQTLSALKTLVAELATNFKETSYQLGTAVLDHFKDRYAADFKDWACLSGAAKSAAICDTVGTAGFDVLAIVLGAKAFKATAALTGKGASLAVKGAKDIGGAISESRAAARMAERSRRTSRKVEDIPAAEIAKIEADYKKFADSMMLNRSTGKGEYVRSTRYWAQWAGGFPEAKQGYKFHVSARPENMQEIAEAILPELRARGLAHKFVHDTKGYVERSINQDTQTGKFIAIYSENPAQAREIQNVINKVMTDKKLNHGDFLDVPGERNVGPGLYVRYGAYYDDYLVRPDGTRVPDVRGGPDPDWAPSL